MAEQEEDLSALPLTDRFAHKNWKVRKEAYEAAASEFKNAQTESDPVVRQFVQDSGIWKAAVTDSNVAAHQDALNALCQFLDIAGTQGCTRTRNLTIAPLVEKGLTSTKPAAKQSALNAILLYVELDKPDPVIEELLPILSHKTPKVVAAALSAFTSIYHEFGCKTVEPKSILKVLPKVFGHADKNVRGEAQNLAVELYRWLREGIKPLFWNDLKPVQQQDLDKLFEPVKNEPTPKPERLLRSQQAKQAAAAATAPAEEDYAEADYEDDGDEIDLAPEAVDVFPKIPADFNERINSVKWKDRKDALDELHNAINVPTIQEGPFDEITRALAKSMKDANIAVVTVAANCIELLAKGLRRSFSKYRSNVLDPILERLKERKQSVVDALAAALDAVVAPCSFSDYLESTMPFFSHKNPQVKLEYTRFLTRALKTSKEAPSLPEVKSISDAGSKLLADSQAPQRDAGAELLGVLLKIMGERIMNAHFEPPDDIRKAKIKEFADAAEVKAKYKPKAAPAPKVVAAPISKKPVVRKPATIAPAKKLAAPAPATESAPAPLQPKPTARPGAPKSGAPRGLRPPSAVAASGKKPAPPSIYAQSPRKNVISPPSEEEDDPMPAPKLSRGLTGRQLSKPSEPAQAQAPTQHMQPLPSAERIELEELRAEVERLRGNTEHLHRENSSLHTRVQELEDHNAQLIEDHTRDVLSIKAKETQLTRARADAESERQSAQSMQREVDRLKRELSRTARVSSPRPSDFGATDLGLESKAYSNGDTLGGRTMSPYREGKENFPAELSFSNENKRYVRDNMLSPSPYSAGPHRPSSRSTNPTSVSPVRSESRANSATGSAGTGYASSRGIGAPPSFQAAPPPVRSQSRTGGLNGSDADNSGHDTGNASNSASAARGGQDGWRRAAEVTQNLKVRIDQMKAKQREGQKLKEKQEQQRQLLQQQQGLAGK